MPDPFDPLPDLPAQPLDANDVAQQRHAAVWAKTFDPSTSQLPRTPTSLALRARGRQDIEDYANTVEEQRMAAEQHRLETDRNAANYALRSRAMDMKARTDQFNMGIAQKKLADAESTMKSVEDARIARMNADKSRVERDNALLKKQADIETDSNKFKTAVAANNDPEDTPEHEAVIIAAYRKYPMARLDQSLAPRIKLAEFNAAARAKVAILETKRADTKAKAEAAGIPLSGFAKGGEPTYHVPAHGRTDNSGDAELKSLKTALANANAKESFAGSDSEKESIRVGMASLRNKINAIEHPEGPAAGAVVGTQAVTAPPTRKTPQTEIIEKNGIKYEVDHANKKVLRVVP